MAIAEQRNEASRKLSIFGVTGSIGQNTVKTILAADEIFSVEVIAARSNVEKLAEQAKLLKARYAVIADESKFETLKTLLLETDIKAAAGEKSIEELAAEPVDWFMSSMVGAAGLKPTLAAIRQGTVVALANKECLVCAGELMMQEVKKYGATLIPVDSEHSAIMQAIGHNKTKHIRHITLTASGGPFRTKSFDEMKVATPKQAVNHPNWSMGAKISIDSATMINKGLEVIEAYHLFPVAMEQIKVVVHPESVIHGMVEYLDGSVLAQLGSPDMVTPIAVALAYPERIEAPHQPFDLLSYGSLTFEPVDEIRFPAVALAKAAVQQNATAPIVLNAANEIAVDAFLNHRLAFTDIVHFVRDSIEKYEFANPKHLDDVIAIDSEVRRRIKDDMDIKKYAIGE